MISVFRATIVVVREGPSGKYHLILYSRGFEFFDRAHNAGNEPPFTSPATHSLAGERYHVPGSAGRYHSKENSAAGTGGAAPRLQWQAAVVVWLLNR
jgi:hypothetical protein